jgi:hypothetical protein
MAPSVRLQVCRNSPFFASGMSLKPTSTFLGFQMSISMTIRLHRNYKSGSNIDRRRLVKHRWECAILPFVAQLFCIDQLSTAGLVLDSSTITTTFTADTNNAANSTYTGGGNVSSLTYNQSYLGGLATASAYVSSITNDSAAGFEFGVGTGVTRDDPTDVITRTTILTVNFSGTWTVVGTSFGPTLYNYAYFAVQGSIPKFGDQGQFVLNVNYPDHSNYTNTLTFNSSNIQQLFYFVPSTVPAFSVGDTFSLSGDISFSFKGNSIGGTALAANSGFVPEPPSFILACLGCLSLLLSRCATRRFRGGRAVCGSEVRRQPNLLPDIGVKSSDV